MCSSNKFPRSYCIIGVEWDNIEPVHFDIYTGLDFAERFGSKVDEIEKRYHKRKCKCPNFLGLAYPRDTWLECWNCNVRSNNDNQ